MSRHLRQLMFWMLLLVSGENFEERPDTRAFDTGYAGLQQAD